MNKAKAALNKVTNMSGMQALTGIGTAVWGINDVRNRVKEGQNPIMAAGSVIAQQAFYNWVGGWGLGLFVGAPLAAATTQAVIGGINNHNNFIRQARTPSSHSFMHTNITSAMQNQALSKMGGLAGSGSDASTMARRYSRR